MSTEKDQPTNPEPQRDLRKVLIEELQQRPVVEILGLVDASGAGGCGWGDDDWELGIGFESWKHIGGKLQQQGLHLRKSVTETELEGLMRQISPYDILHVQARVAEQNVFGRPEALLVHIVRKDIFDADLKKRAAQLQEPVTFKDEQLGVFTLDRKLGWYEAAVCWDSTNIRLSLSVESDDDLAPCLAIVHSLWEVQSVWSARILDYACKELLGLKNGDWLGEDETRLNAEEFKNRMNLDSITAHPDGSFEFWYDDDGLFWGHSIRVSGSLSEGPTSAGIEG